MDGIIAVVLVGLLMGLAIGIPLYLHKKRQQYIATLTARGWQFVEKPTDEPAWGLNVVPFGVGEKRRVDDLITGTTAAGVPFRAFTYSTTGSGYDVVCPIGHSLPEFHLFPEHAPRQGVQGCVVVPGAPPGYTAVARSVDEGRVLLDALVPHLTGLAVIDVVVDHDHLVTLRAPIEAEALAPVVEATGRAARALADSPLQGPPPPPRFGLYQRPGWEFRPRDDSMLRLVDHDGRGYDHRATNIVLSPPGPLPFVTLRHDWKTDRTVTDTDSEGRTTTRTVTDNHTEYLAQFLPAFSFPAIKLNRGLMGNKVTFEWDDFNRRHTVRCPDPRFAHDVFHPRMMEYVMASPFACFEIDGRCLFMPLRQHDPDSMLAAQQFLYGFFGRVPRFVWQNLGQTPPVPVLKGDI